MNKYIFLDWFWCEIGNLWIIPPALIIYVSILSAAKYISDEMFGLAMILTAYPIIPLWVFFILMTPVLMITFTALFLLVAILISKIGRKES